ncbi:uncharacterized protein SPSK_00910 [Sporothrix schenckii 1099-18]|uniref:MARVEL domain-containing protein n=2 Tax=Sporothrix schenckii TaxID=29908 RepID=U7PK51_SPOS1|nr:uncharacterized protein SPSK_00910 [Sporothrix schenckii 1099-18]ERS95927.1 hypothetical protein HMPREF1624_07461 [Sporothrix schenckii ATCC 58251]KJR81835.1 hypothetical protein SPSK_00910 [Sporothrix schenckii 1099-18]
MLLVDLFSMILRLAELAFAAIVAGLTGVYLHAVRGSSTWDQSRFIYTEVVAGLAILLAIVWLFPFSGSFIHWPTDLLISILWFVAFGLIVNWLHGSCGNIFNWTGITINSGNSCPEWKANIAFSFLSAICWLVSALLGIYWVHRHRTVPATAAPPATGYRRRRWYRSRV